MLSQVKQDIYSMVLHFIYSNLGPGTNIIIIMKPF